MTFCAVFTRRDGSQDRHTFRNTLEYANYIAKENMAHWKEGDGKFIIEASGAMAAPDEIRQGRDDDAV